MHLGKIIAPSDIGSLCSRLRDQSATLVFTNGVFDLLHPGHIEYLTQARKLGIHLMVAVNSDESARRIKGENRPLVSKKDRMEVLAALSAVSFVTWFEEETPAEIIRLVRPDVLVKGGDWKPEQIVGRDFVESYGGTVLSIPFVPGYSTTSMIERILTLPDPKKNP